VPAYPGPVEPATARLAVSSKKVKSKRKNR
jgi:hypothetical protein